jgi:hypothetical protein
LPCESCNRMALMFTISPAGTAHGRCGTRKACYQQRNRRHSVV